MTNIRFETSRSLNGDKIIYIARDSNGIVRLRAESLEALNAAIEDYKKPVITGEDKGQAVDAHLDALVETALTEEEVGVDEVKTARGEITSLTEEEIAKSPREVEKQKEFLKNALKEKIEEQKEKSTKKSFWDRLK